MTDPAPGSVLSASPTTLTLQFSHQINPDTLADGDVLLVQLADDGSVSGFTGLAAASLDPTGTQAVVTVDQPLTPGHYQVWISGTTDISDVDGTSLIGDGNALTVADFSISVAGVTLADAVDLGTPGQAVTSVPGSLDFLANPYDVALYKITLPAGHFWRLGLEVSAQRDGGTLDSALALFDSAGRPIATDEILLIVCYVNTVKPLMIGIIARAAALRRRGGITSAMFVGGRQGSFTVHGLINAK